MTFVPTPKGDLVPLAQLEGAWAALGQQVLSRLYHAEAAADWAAAAIADVYARLPGVSSSWLWSPTVAGNPGSGQVYIAIVTGNDRLITLSKTDAMGAAPSMAALMAGATLVLTDDPVTPPTTAFRQYLLTEDVLDHGGWVSFRAIRVATFGTQDTPAAGTPVRLLLR